MDEDLLARLHRGDGPAWRPPARPSRPPRRGRWPPPSTPPRRRTGVHPRSSPTSQRDGPVLARARWSGSWPASPEPVPFGRMSTDTLRLGILERDRSLPPRELYDRTISSLERFERRWRTLTPEDLGRRGLHPRLGEMTIAEIAGPVHRRRTWPSTWSSWSTILRDGTAGVLTRRCSSSTRSRSGSSSAIWSGGRLERLGELRLRWAPLALLGLVVQVLIFSEPVGGRVGAAGPGRSTSRRRHRPDRGRAQRRDPGRRR